jgi:hypothetical protein
MNATIFCPSCSQIIHTDAEGRMPPWCRHCGSDLKGGPKNSSPAPSAEAPASDSPAPSANGGQMSNPSPRPDGLEIRPTALAVNGQSQGLTYIHACVPGFLGRNTLYRIYCTKTDLLVFRIGSGTMNAGQVLHQSPLRVMPVGAEFQALTAPSRNRKREMDQLRLTERLSELDAADEPTLRDYAFAGAGAFIAGLEDVSWLRIDPPSGYIRFFCRLEHDAVLKFEHRTVGKMTLALPSWKNARQAIAELPKLFGETVQINLTWGSAGRRAAAI